MQIHIYISFDILNTHHELFYAYLSRFSFPVFFFFFCAARNFHFNGNKISDANAKIIFRGGFFLLWAQFFLSSLEAHIAFVFGFHLIDRCLMGAAGDQLRSIRFE